MSGLEYWLQEEQLRRPRVIVYLRQRGLESVFWDAPVENFDLDRDLFMNTDVLRCLRRVVVAQIGDRIRFRNQRRAEELACFCAGWAI